MHSRLPLILLLIFTLAPGLVAQQTLGDGSNTDEALQQDSPLFHLQTIDFGKTAVTTRPFNCWPTSYYSSSVSSTNYLDSIPTMVWAARMSMPSHPAIKACTLWTVGVNFYWQPKHSGDIDTLNIFMREVYAPYNEFYHSKYLMKLGNNVGDIELDPPVPPYPRPLIGQLRDVYVGLYVSGHAGSRIYWRIKTPGQFTSPPRSVIFAGSTPAPAASILGYTADWVFDARFCCNVIPVELSSFIGHFDGTNVNLEWRTESETNNFQFEVQRSLHAEGPWESREFLPGKGTTMKAETYTFTDNLGTGPPLPEAYWYRLRQTDFDGTVNDIPPIRVATIAPEDLGYRLNAAYPNPMSRKDYTTIGFDLPEESPVMITIYDALGRSVVKVLDRTMPAGHHEAQWWAGRASYALDQGTYFIVMKAGRFTATKKLTLLR